MPVDARTDVYALGCVLYECLAGQAPFERDGELAVMHAHLVQPPPRLSAALPSLPKGLDAVIATAMAKSKDDRYATCGDLLAATRQAVLERRSPLATGIALAAPVAAETPAPVGEAQELAPAAAEAPPRVEAAVAPAAPQPVPSAPDGRRGSSTLRLMLVLAVLAAIGSGVVTYLATRGSGSTQPPSTVPTTAPSTVVTHTSPTTPTTTSTPVTSPAVTSALTGVAGTFAAGFSDQTIASSCSKSPHPGGKVTLNCTSTTPGGQPVVLHVDLFGSHRIVRKNYQDDALGPYTAAGGTLDSGACSKAAWNGEGQWARGRRVCFVAGKSTTRAARASVPPSARSSTGTTSRPTWRCARRSRGASARSAPQLSAWWDAHKGDFGG